jgi:ABC-type proline/glycine betaine transport system permease subunit
MKLNKVLMIALNLVIVASAVAAFTSGYKITGP